MTRVLPICALLMCLCPKLGGATEVETVCEDRFLAPEAVDQRLRDTLAVFHSAEPVLRPVEGRGRISGLIKAIAAMTGQPVPRVRDEIQRMISELESGTPLANLGFEDAVASELVFMGMHRNLSTDETVRKLVEMARALVPRRVDARVIYALTKTSIFHDRSPEDLVRMLDDVRREAPAAERRIRQAHAPLIARRPHSRLMRRGPWLNDEIVLAIIESTASRPSHESVDEDLAVTEDLLGDEVGARRANSDLEAIIKSAGGSRVAARRALSALVMLDARLAARFDRIDETIKTLSVYTMLLGLRAPRRVVEFIDHTLACSRPHGDFVDMAVVAKTNFDLAADVAASNLLRSAMFNPYH